MEKPSRVRRELLRGAIDDNLEALAGQPLGSRRRARERRRRILRRVVLGGAAAAATAISITAWFAGAHPPADSGGVRPETLAEVTVRHRPAAISPLAQVEQLNRNLSAHPPEELVRQVLRPGIRKVAVDPGHGGKDGGTSLEFGLLEKDLVRDIADRLVRRLDGAAIATVLTRDGDETVSLRERADRANAAGADLFLSIHVNWLPDRNARGIETYFLGTTDDPFLNRLAAAENRDSGYSMGDVRQLLDGIYADVRQAESRQLAEEVQASLFGSLREANQRIVSRGVMTAPFVVLVATDMPAILAEVACLSNANEARLLAIPEYRQRIADALYGGVMAYSQSVSSPEEILAQKGSDHEQGEP